MRRRLNLPVSSSEGVGRPTIDAARKRLGGRVESSSLAGAIVSFDSNAGTRAIGVVLFADDLECDVWIAEGIVRRMPVGDIARFDGVIDDPTQAISRDARRFTSLVEGQRVRIVEPDSPARTATIVEKCRYGALVELEGGSVLAVGFRKLASDAQAFGS